jgi:hypothetical protein
VDKLASAVKKYVTDKDALKQIGEDPQRLVANAGVPPSGAA